MGGSGVDATGVSLRFEVPPICSWIDSSWPRSKSASLAYGPYSFFAISSALWVGSLSVISSMNLEYGMSWSFVNIIKKGGQIIKRLTYSAIVDIIQGYFHKLTYKGR